MRRFYATERLFGFLIISAPYTFQNASTTSTPGLRHRRELLADDVPVEHGAQQQRQRFRD
jgi:hypothetical protein